MKVAVPIKAEMQEEGREQVPSPPSLSNLLDDLSLPSNCSSRLSTPVPTFEGTLLVIKTKPCLSMESSKRLTTSCNILLSDISACFGRSLPVAASLPSDLSLYKLIDFFCIIINVVLFKVYFNIHSTMIKTLNWLVNL